jgi:AcrR family transcriptional regulator
MRTTVPSGMARVSRDPAGFVRVSNNFGRPYKRPHPACRAKPPPPTARRPQAGHPAGGRALFAQHGYHGVTIRQIADEAGVPLALVGYYYGQKHELFQAIFDHWGHDHRGAAGRGCGGHQDARAPARLPRIVAAFIEPVLRIRASAEGEYYALLVARELGHVREDTDQVLRQWFDPLANAFIDALHGLMPHASRAQVAWCYQFMLGALLHHMSDNRVDPPVARRDPGPRRRPWQLLIDFIVGGIRAALPRPRPAHPENPHQETP